MRHPKTILKSITLFCVIILFPACTQPIAITRENRIKLAIEQSDWDSIASIAKEQLSNQQDELQARENLCFANCMAGDLKPLDEFQSTLCSIQAKSSIEFFLRAILAAQKSNTNEAFAYYCSLYQSKSVLISHLASHPVFTGILPDVSDWVVIDENFPDPNLKNIIQPKSLGGTMPPELYSQLSIQAKHRMVALKISINTEGMPISSTCISENSDYGRICAAWAHTWRYTPARLNGKSIPCTWVIRIPKIRSITTTSIERISR